MSEAGDKLSSRVLKMRLKAPEDEMRFMDSFDPSVRRTDTLKRKHSGKTERVEAEKTGRKKTVAVYDDRGVCLPTGLDLCDCLDTQCPGCHFPCPKCGSEKCGDECRRHRTWSFHSVDIDGQYEVLRQNPKYKR